MKNYETFNHGIPPGAVARSMEISEEVKSLRDVLNAEFPKQEIANEAAKPLVEHETQLTLINGEGQPDQEPADTPEKIDKAAA